MRPNTGITSATTADQEPAPRPATSPASSDENTSLAYALDRITKPAATNIAHNSARLTNLHMMSQSSPTNPVNQKAPRHPNQSAMGVTMSGVTMAPREPPL